MVRALGLAVCQQDEGRGVLGQVVVFQFLQPLEGGGVHIGAAPWLQILHGGVQDFQLRPVAPGGADFHGLAAEGDEDVHLTAGGLEEMFPGV